MNSNSDWILSADRTYGLIEAERNKPSVTKGDLLCLNSSDGGCDSIDTEEVRHRGESSTTCTRGVEVILNQVGLEECR